MKKFVLIFILCLTIIIVASTYFARHLPLYLKFDDGIVRRIVRQYKDGVEHDKYRSETRQQRDELSLKLNRLQETYQQLVCDTLRKKNEVSETGGWCSESVKTGHITDTKLVEGLRKLFANQTVIGLGDGPGEYRRLLLRSGSSAVRKYDAYDGAPHIRNLTNGQVNFLDLTLAQYWLPVYDWVMCLEVLEHIPQEHENTVLDNLARAAGTGIVLSWAVPGQGGHYHINCQPPQHVKDVMEQRMFVVDEMLSRQLKESASLSWLKRNVMVFKKVKSTNSYDVSRTLSLTL